MGSVKSKRATSSVVSNYSRRAHYAGSWYEAGPEELDATLTQFLNDADAQNKSTTNHNGTNHNNTCSSLRALIAPHAGYSYSGPTAAYAYRELRKALLERNNDDTTTVLVLHPSHYEYLDGCAVSGASVVETPLGNMDVDIDLREEILQLSPQFTVMTQATDEQEHSGELHYPYIVKCCKDVQTTIQILPVMVGSLNVPQEQFYGKLLAPILARPNILTIISTDFCHWGTRFRYQPFLHSSENIVESIQQLDQTGMTHIEMQEPGAFAKYVKQTCNTICGRHPIGVWLQAVYDNKISKRQVLEIKFVKYAQSAQVRYATDSSVSYASAVATTTTTRR